MNLWIITVNFGDTTVTESFIDSLSFVEDNKLIKIGIADNASSANSRNELNQIINKTKLEAKIFSYNKNYFYWPAIKKVINQLKAENRFYPDWIIVCNNDITFTEKNFFQELSKIDGSTYPIIGPNIINENGIKLNPFMINPLSKLEKFYWRMYFVSYPLSHIMLGIKKFFRFFIPKKNERNILTNKKVYAIHGSLILFSDHFFNKGGWLDDNFEMYGEELTVAEIAKQLDFSITYFPNLIITHHEHQSTKTIDKRLLFYKAKQSYKYFRSIYQK